MNKVKYKLPFPIRSKNQIADHIEIFPGIGIIPDKMEIIDKNGCVISPKRHPEIQEKYMKCYNLWKSNNLTK